MTSTAISVVDVSKKYYIGRTKATGERNLLSSIQDVRRWLKHWRSFGQTESNAIWALRNVSFDVPTGESWGVIGRNGSGKSTLLKIIANVTLPTSGSFRAHGRLSAMLSAGAGFKPELTGRENVYLNAAILGLSQRDIRAQFDKIVDFAGVAPFIDTPIKHYSSGMKVRLAFSIAVNLDPDILLVDEVLTVGDYAFRHKSLERMKEFRASGERTILLVSHNLSVVKAFCENAIWLDSGVVRAMGGVDDVVRAYLREMGQNEQQLPEPDDDLRHEGTGEARLLSLTLLDKSGMPANTFMHGDSVTFQIEYETQQPVAEPYFSVSIVRIEDNITATRLHSGYDLVYIDQIDGRGVVSVTIPQLLLMPGAYRLIVHIGGFGAHYDRVTGFPRLTVIPGPSLSQSSFKFDSSDMVMYAPAEWHVQKDSSD
jgi:lipopolysaccharide transport system ATP-binding protein